MPESKGERQVAVLRPFNKKAGETFYEIVTVNENDVSEDDELLMGDSAEEQASDLPAFAINRSDFVRLLRGEELMYGPLRRMISIQDGPFDIVEDGTAPHKIVPPEPIEFRGEPEAQVEYVYSEIVEEMKQDDPTLNDRIGNVLQNFVAKVRSVFRGGAGSGHFDHEGRPGEVGGSAPSGESYRPVYELKTEGARLKKGYAGIQEGFLISTQAGASAKGYLYNADFPKQRSEKTRGELFYVEVPEGQRRKGLGTSLAVDALRQMISAGSKTVNMDATTEAGGALIASLLAKGYIEGPVRESGSKAEYRISKLVERGGAGSGHFDHEGRPGEVGGSLPDEIDPDKPVLFSLGGKTHYGWLGTGIVCGADSRLRAGKKASPIRNITDLEDVTCASCKKKLKKRVEADAIVPSGEDAGIEVKHMPLTKTAINGYIKWSTSRYNEYRKKDVVDWAQQILKGEKWHPVSKDSSKRLLRELSGSDNIELRELDADRDEVKIKKMVVSAGVYAETGPMTGITYLINGEEGYIAAGFGGSTPDDFRYEYERVYFGGKTEGEMKAVVRGPLRRIFIESSHSRSKCMECEKPPTVAAQWANGHGMAWFCLPHFKEWIAEDDRDIIGVWHLSEGECPADIRKSPKGTEKIRKLGEGVSEQEIIKRLDALIERGGEGSGHEGHKGRPGEVGGSLPSTGKIKEGREEAAERKKQVKFDEGVEEVESGEEKLPEAVDVYPVEISEGERVDNDYRPNNQKFQFNENLDKVGQIPSDDVTSFLASLPTDTRTMTADQRWDLLKVMLDMPAEKLFELQSKLDAMPRLMDLEQDTSTPSWKLNNGRQIEGMRDVTRAATTYLSYMQNAGIYFEKDRDVFAESLIHQAEMGLAYDLYGVTHWSDDAKRGFAFDKPDVLKEQSMVERGGGGSGYTSERGHKGRVGEVGGSVPSGGAGGEPSGEKVPEEGEGPEVSGTLITVGDDVIMFDSEEQYEQIKAMAAEQNKAATEREPELTSLMSNLAATNGGDMAGLEFAVKSEDSILRKIREKMVEDDLSEEDATARVNDANRYTMLFNPDTYVEKVKSVQKELKAQGWNRYDHKWKNYWGQGDDYDGYNTVVVNESGERFELQFHTYESIQIKRRSHEIYAKLRTTPESQMTIRKDYVEEMRVLWSADYEKPLNFEQLEGVVK